MYPSQGERTACVPLFRIKGNTPFYETVRLNVTERAIYDTVCSTFLEHADNDLTLMTSYIKLTNLKFWEIRNFAPSTVTQLLDMSEKSFPIEF